MIFILCALVLIAGLVLAWWIKREGERSWDRHQEMVRRAKQREQMARLTKAFTEVRITLVDNLTPALQKAGVALRQMADALSKDGAS